MLLIFGHHVPWKNKNKNSLNCLFCLMVTKLKSWNPPLLLTAVLLPLCVDPAISQTLPDWNFIDQYCSECHNFDDQAGGLAFELLDHESLLDDSGTWELAVKKLRTGMMPPAGKERPADSQLSGFVSTLENRLDSEHAALPDPGNEGMGRLNRAEYINVIRDLLGFDATDIVEKLLPPDVPEEGFDNLASSLSVSPTLIEAWTSVAMRIGREAVGDQSMIPTQISYAAPDGDQTSHVEGLPLGTRGGMLVTHNFPLDAVYEIRALLPRGGGIFNNQAFCEAPNVVLTLNGLPLEPQDPSRFQMAIPAGPQTIGLALVDEQRCEGVNDFYDVYSLGGRVQGLEINGPFEVSGAGNTPSRQAIFSCYPASASQETGCAREILGSLATSAYRHPVDRNSEDVDTLMQFFTKGRDLAGFETGIQYAISRMLIDPQFLYQSEVQPANLAPGEIYRISDLELASRLSFFLWSSIPDQELLSLASAGQLSNPAVFEQQVRRMLRDEKSSALVDNFASQWLKLRELDAALPQDQAFNDSLRQSFREETELLFNDLIREDRGLLHLLNPGYTWLNAELAAHYGIEDVRGDYMRRVPLDADSPRSGLLGNGSILTATSAANRTSPVLRGAWIIENLLGAPVPLPPPGVETDLTNDTVPEGRVVNTLRDRMELHRENPVCSSCHQVMDPIGFALENFDLVGRWRDTDNGYPVNASSNLADGTPVSSPMDMRRALMDRSETVATTFIEKLMTYALGRAIEAHDMPSVRQIIHDTAESEYRFSDVIVGITSSLPFQYRIAVPDNPIAMAN